MKKVTSLLLSIAMIIGVLSTNVSAFAAGWLNYSREVVFDTDYSECCNSSDYRTYTYAPKSSDNYVYYDVLYFKVPTKGKVSLYVESESDYNTSYHINPFVGATYAATDYTIFNADDIDNEYVLWNDDNRDKCGYSSARGVYYEQHSAILNKGEYYILVSYIAHDWTIDRIGYSFNIGFTPSISKPSTLKVTTRNTTSIKLSWSKVGDVDGYQLQRKSGDTWKTLTNTTSNSHTAKDLKTGTNYHFRVRSYVEANGKKYYSAWKTLDTPTKPSTPAIKAPSTNKKHQIIAKWIKVSAGTGYRVQFSKKKDFSSVIATKTVSGISKTSYTGKNFTKDKTYYVRVRAYKTVDGTKYYGAWSKGKSIKCK